MSESTNPPDERPASPSLHRADVTTNVVWFLVGQVEATEGVRHIPINTMPMQIGRRSDLALCLPSQTVSSIHAEIVEEDGALLVRDLQSTNGTFVNGIPVMGQTPLYENDLVQFSDLAFRLHREVADGESQTVAGDAGDRAVALIQFDKLMDGDAAIPFYQPIVDMLTMETFGFEVVGRSRLFGLRSPREMFQVAAQLNLEAELSRLFRREGIRKGLSLPHKPNIFVNTHPVELGKPGLIESLQEIREFSANHPVTLEIHEAAVTDPKSMRELRAILNDLGMQLAYDDFGAGQARLVELVEIRPDYLKFDIQLVQGIYNAPARRQQMLATLVEMVRELDIAPLAEGIETEADSEACRQFGFEFGQGYYYGKPASVKNYGGAR